MGDITFSSDARVICQRCKGELEIKMEWDDLFKRDILLVQPCKNCMKAEEKLKEIMEEFDHHLKTCHGKDEPEGVVNIMMSKTLAEKWVRDIKEILE